MNTFDSILLNIIILLFPLIICILYDRYNKVYNLNKSNLFEDFAITTSFYFILKYNTNNIQLYLLMNLPLLLAYLKHKKTSILVITLSCFLIITHQYNNIFPIVILEYIIYYYLHRV